MSETRLVDAAALAEAFEAAADGFLVPFGMGQVQHTTMLTAETRILGSFDAKALETASATATILRSIAAVYRRTSRGELDE